MFRRCMFGIVSYKKCSEDACLVSVSYNKSSGDVPSPKQEKSGKAWFGFLKDYFLIWLICKQTLFCFYPKEWVFYDLELMFLLAHLVW